jgi:hypothetical protein
MTTGIVGTATWTRDEVTKEWLRHPHLMEWLEGRIPEGMYVVLTCGGRPGNWGAVLMRHEEPRAVEVARTTEHRTLSSAVGTVLYEGVRA